jgi:hypothetical protein
MVFGIFFDKINLKIAWLVQAGAGADGRHFPGEIFEAPQKKARGFMITAGPISPEGAGKRMRVLAGSVTVQAAGC